MMFRDITLRTALVISVSVHLLALSSWDLFHLGLFKTQKRPRHQIEVFYISEDKPQKTQEKIIKSLPRKYNLEQKKLLLKQKEDIAKEHKEVPLKQVIKEEAYLKDSLKYIEAEYLEEYISYYQLLREIIKKNVTRYYTGSGKEGEVYVIFTLKENGALKKISIDESRSSARGSLQKIALRSLKSASPFPPFPKELKKRELIFSIVIIFKKE